MRLLTIKRPLTVCRADCCGENLNSGVNGKMIRDMYVKAKSCVKTKHGLSHFLGLKLWSASGGKICRQFCFRSF